MENSLKGLLLAAGTIITCIVISLGFFIAREARDTAADGAGQISKLNAEFNESDKVIYDGLKVSGSEVVNVINKFRDSLSIIVVTGKGCWYYNVALNIQNDIVNRAVESEVKNAQSPDKLNYINPNAQFMGDILRDDNNTIVGIVFTQEGISV